MSVLRKIIAFLSSPITVSLNVLLSAFILLSAPQLLFYINREQPEYYYCIYICACYLVSAYIMTLIYRLFSSFAHFRKIFSVIVTVIFVVSTIYQILNLLSVFSYGTTINWNIIQIVSNTNFQEASEFASAFFIRPHIIASVLLFIFLIVFSLTSISIGKRAVVVRPLGSILCILALLLTIHNKNIFNDCYDLSVFRWAFQERIDLRENLCHPEIKETKDRHPQYLVVIIGESFSRSHSSLYGYKQMTNPELSKLENNGDMVVYDSVVSPGVGTFEAFEYIINTHYHGDSRKWYETPTLAEIFKIVGYKTIWFSNQAKNGLLDNMSSGFSRVCDEEYFTGYPNRNKYDGALISLLENYQFIHDQKYLLFFHLMGQHEGFHERYPTQFEHFNYSMYSTYSNEQSKILAEYDNATLYNDYVVSEIMQQFKNKEACVVYFSDHGLDLYESDDKYYGHAKGVGTSREIGIQIPFTIYMSKSFQKNYPDETETIFARCHQSFSTEFLTISLMDLYGFCFKKDESVSVYSIFK